MYKSYYRFGVARRTLSPKAKTPTQTWTADAVWGAAAYAHRINGAYLKEDRIEHINDNPVVTARSSKSIMRDAIADSSLVTNEDIQIGQEARDWHKKNLLVKALKGQLNDFEQSVSRVAGLDEFNDTQRLEIAITASQIQSYIVNRRVTNAISRVEGGAGFVGQVGDKVTCNVEVVRAVYSQNYGCYFITAITDKNQSVFFSYRENHNAGTWLTIKGTVKSCRDNSTQLNRVKVF